MPFIEIRRSWKSLFIALLRLINVLQASCSSFLSISLVFVDLTEVVPNKFTNFNPKVTHQRHRYNAHSKSYAKCDCGGFVDVWNTIIIGSFPYQLFSERWFFFLLSFRQRHINVSVWIHPYGLILYQYKGISEIIEARLRTMKKNEVRC